VKTTATSSKQQAASSKQQAASSKQQAASSKQQAASSKQRFQEHSPGLLADYRSFSKYVSGAGFFSSASDARTAFVSALDKEMQFWCPPKASLPKRYRPNDIEHNAWHAMQQMGIKGTFPLSERSRIFRYLRDTFPSLPADSCEQVVFDRWFQKAADHLRKTGLDQPLARGASQAYKPSALATLGLAQKLINIYLKYAFCWAVAGRYSDGAFSSCIIIPNITDFTCALHAPIDRILLNALKSTTLGQKWSAEGFLDKSAGRIKNSLGEWVPWSKLDCWGAYWRIQQDLRAWQLNR
jgi:hypothetical protein